MPQWLRSIGGWLRGLPGQVASSLVVQGITAVLLVVVGPILLGLVAGDVTVPAWLAFAIVAVAMIGAALFGYGAHPPPTEATAELRSQVERLDELVKLQSYYTEQTREMLVNLQRAIAGKIPDFDHERFIERGILEPARDWLTQDADEEIRLSILEPEVPERRVFVMPFAAGHTYEGQKNLRLDMAGSFAGFAFSTKEMQWTNDVDTEKMWRPHPKAERPYGSLIAVPLMVGDDPVAVFNIISTKKEAFTLEDRQFTVVTGAIISIVWGIYRTNGASAAGSASA